MKKSRGLIGIVIGVLMPLILILAGAGLAVLGVTQGPLWLLVAGLVLVGAGVLWGVLMLDLSNPFDLF
jgi:pantothenate kinase